MLEFLGEIIVYAIGKLFLANLGKWIKQIFYFFLRLKYQPKKMKRYDLFDAEDYSNCFVGVLTIIFIVVIINLVVN
jgi:hypothetical protein